MPLRQPKRIDHRERRRQRHPWQMVIRDDDIDPGGAGNLDRLVRADTRITGDDQCSSTWATDSTSQPFAQPRQVDSMPLAIPLRDMNLDRRPASAQSGHEQRRRRLAIDIEITPDQNRLRRTEGPVNPRHRHLEVRKLEGRGLDVMTRIKEGPHLRQIGHPLTDQPLRHQWMAPHLPEKIVANHYRPATLPVTMPATHPFHQKATSSRSSRSSETAPAGSSGHSSHSSSVGVATSRSQRDRSEQKRQFRSSAVSG